MRIQKTSGTKPKGRACEAYPFGSLREVDEKAVHSLRGGNKLQDTYGKTRWNGWVSEQNKSRNPIAQLKTPPKKP